MNKRYINLIIIPANARNCLLDIIASSYFYKTVIVLNNLDLEINRHVLSTCTTFFLFQHSCSAMVMAMVNDDKLKVFLVFINSKTSLGLFK